METTTAAEAAVATMSREDVISLGVAWKQEVINHCDAGLATSHKNYVGLKDSIDSLKDEMEKRMKAIEGMVEELKAGKVGYDLDAEIEKQVGTVTLSKLEELTKAIEGKFQEAQIGTSGGRDEVTKRLRTKDAEKFMPEVAWAEGAYDFVDLADDLTTWIGMLDPELDAEEFMKWVSNQEDPEAVENSRLGEWTAYPTAGAISKLLHAVLLKRTKSDAKVVVKCAGSGEGLKAWRQLVNDFAPKSTTDGSALMAQIIAPDRAKNLAELRSFRTDWEKMVKDYEHDFETITDTVKEAALKAIIPLDLLQSRFRGKDMGGYKGLTKELGNYLRNKSAGTTLNKNIKSKELLQPCDEGERGEGKEVGGEEGKAVDLLANLMWMAKGKGKSKGKKGGDGWQGKEGGGKGYQGGGGKGYQGGWQGGKGQGKADKGKGKGEEYDGGKAYGKGGKGDKGKGKGLGMQFKDCYRCGQYGHIAIWCPSLYSFEAEEQEEAYDEEVDLFASLEETECVPCGSWRSASWISGARHFQEEMVEEDEEPEEEEGGSRVAEGIIEVGERGNGLTSGDPGRGGASRLMMAAMPKSPRTSTEMPLTAFIKSSRKESQKAKKKKKKMSDFTMSLEGPEAEGELMEMRDDAKKSANVDGYRKVTAVVDSGATRPVIPPEILPEMEIVETEESKAGHSFRGAGKNGAPIPNMGEQNVIGFTMEGQRRAMKWTVAPVRKPLISVGKLVESGNEVVLGKNPRIINQRNGQVTKLRKQGGVYLIDIWIWVGKQGQRGDSNKAPVFARPK